jgi:hypothetical protein
MTGGLTKVMQLKPSTWNWKSAPEVSGQGFIAHELQAIVPDAVCGEKDELYDDGNPKFQGIDTSGDNQAGRLQLGVLRAVAEFEGSLIGSSPKLCLEGPVLGVAAWVALMLWCCLPRGQCAAWLPSGDWCRVIDPLVR